MVRTTTWSSIGKDVSQCKDMDAVLKEAGLDYTVKKCDLFTTLDEDNPINPNNAIGLSGYQATVNEKTGEVLGLVGKNYEVCNNVDAFDFVNYISDDLTYEKAGQTSGGMVYIIAALPQLTILDDTYTPYVIFQNGFNGGYTLKATICPLRIVCQNQFNMAFRESPNTVSIRHTSAMHDKLVDARAVLARSADYMKVVNNQFERYAAMKISSDKIDEIVEEVFPIHADMKEITKSRVLENRAAFMTAYNQDDNSNFRNTILGLVNAEADYLTHRTPARLTRNWTDNQFTSVTFNPELMNSFINIVSAKAA